MTVQPEARPAPDRPVLTLRVSRDSGRTWEPLRRFYPRECPPPDTGGMPPCSCPVICPDCKSKGRR